MIASESRAFRRKMMNWVFTVACVAATAIALGALLLILWSLVAQGLSAINLEIFTMDTPGAGATKGGLRNAILGSIMMCAVAMLIAVGVGIMAGTWLAEIGGDSRYGHAVRFLNDVLLSAPSILIGLFVYQVMVTTFGYSGWAGAVALAILATPVVTRTTEDILNLQANSLREAGMALGASQFTTIRLIIWKAAGAGLLTGGLLGFARISGETAPLLMTTGSSRALPRDWWALLNDWTSSVPLKMSEYALSTDPLWIKLAWGGALLVAVAVLGINVLGRWLAREKKA